MSYLGSDIVPADTDQRSPRKSQLIRAKLVDSANGAHAVTIRNVSEMGIGGVSPDRHLVKGESVTILFRDDVRVAGTVAWINGERFGIQLREHLNLEVLADLIRQKQATNVEDSNWEVRGLHKVITPPRPECLRRI